MDQPKVTSGHFLKGFNGTQQLLVTNTICIALPTNNH